MLSCEGTKTTEFQSKRERLASLEIEIFFFIQRPFNGTLTNSSESNKSGVWSSSTLFADIMYFQKLNEIETCFPTTLKIRLKMIKTRYDFRESRFQPHL